MRRVAVLGLGTFGRELALRLAQLGADVLAVDKNPEVVREIDRHVSSALVTDIASEDALRQAGLAHADVAIVCLGDDIQDSLLASALLKKLGVPEVWVRAINDAQAQILDALKVHRIMHFDREMANTVANLIATPGTRMFLEITPYHAIAEVPALPEMHGVALKDLDFRRRYRVSVVAIRGTPEGLAGAEGSDPASQHAGAWNESKAMNSFPGPDDVIQKGDHILVIGPKDAIKKLQARTAKG